ncbi:7308_t:CDS:1, partial [Paraglomus occultum]
ERRKLKLLLDSSSCKASNTDASNTDTQQLTKKEQAAVDAQFAKESQI